MKRWLPIAGSLIGFFALFFLLRFGFERVEARAQAPAQRKTASRSADFALINGTGPINRDVVGQGCLPLRLWYTDEATNWSAPRRLQVFVAVYEAKGRNSVPGVLLTSWASPEPMTTQTPDSATGELTQDIPLLPGRYAFEVYLCDPDQEVVEEGWRMDYQPDLENYPGKVLKAGLCRLTVQ